MADSLARVDLAQHRPTIYPIESPSDRPTVRPVLLRRKTNIVLTAMTSTPFIATTTETSFVVAADGRHFCSGYE